MKKQIKDAVLYGIGYMAGKHSLKISKKERDEIASVWVKKVLNQTKM